MKYLVEFKRELSLKVEVEARNSSAAEREAEAKLATTHAGEWEEIDTTIEDVQKLDGEEDDQDDSEDEA